MNWKEFFKPSIGKIIIFVLLLYPVFFILIGLTSTLLVDPGEPIKPLIPLNLQFSRLVVLTIIFSYLISGIIAAFYKLIRER